MDKLLIILFLIFNSMAFADPLEKPHIFIFHINGINTKRDEAFENIKALTKISQISSNIITWDFLYNPTSGDLYNDLLDVLRQKRQEKKKLTIDDYVAAYMKAHHLSYPVGSENYETLKIYIKYYYATDLDYVGANFDYILQEYYSKTHSNALADKLFGSVVSLLKKRDLANTGLLLLPHSQGNLYANSLSTYLKNVEHFPEKNLAIVGVANPADTIESTIGVIDGQKVWQYVTAQNDYVISLLRELSVFNEDSIFLNLFVPAYNPFFTLLLYTEWFSLVKQPMAANVYLKSCQDYFCHGLRTAYLADARVAFNIAERINIMIWSLGQSLSEIKGNNKIVHLKCDYNHDFDLFDPGNEILFNGGEFDENLFGYVIFDNKEYLFDLIGRRSYGLDLVFGFPGKVKAGEYAVAMHSPINGAAFYFVSNNLTQATYFDTMGCSEATPPPNNCDLMTGPQRYPQFDINRKYPSICIDLPQNCINNKFIFGKFTLSLP